MSDSGGEILPQKTPFYDQHVALGGKVVDFHGWLLPLQFRGILEEHRHTRESVSVFDCSHMAEFRLVGRDTIQEYDRLFTANLTNLPVGRGRYGAILNDQGRILDDVISIRLAEEELFVVSNAGPASRISALLTALKHPAEDVSGLTAKIDVQGPRSREVLEKAGLTVVSELGYFSARRTSWRGLPIVVTRMGYTGELGFELYIPWESASDVWTWLLQLDGVMPAGLGSRDTLRLEMGYPLSGQDFDDTKTPLEASQSRFVDWEKDFVGKEVLVEMRRTGGYAQLVGFSAPDRRAPRTGYTLSVNGEPVGVVTSGTFGPSVGYGIGLGYVGSDFVTPGTRLMAGPKQLPVEVVSVPFYKQGTCRR